MRKIALTLIVAGAAFATEASAQVIMRASSVPPGQRPPAGMCRVWIDGVPAGRQPRPTDCARARATAPLNSRIIYGSDAPFPGRAVGRFRDGNCDFERRPSNLGDVFFGLRTSQRDMDRDCRVSASRTRDQGVWYPVGRDANGNVIFERRTRTPDGRIVVERARSRNGRELERIGSRPGSRIDRDTDRRRVGRDRDSDRSRISRGERDRVKALEKARRDHEKDVRKAQRDREKAIERARREAERNARGNNGKSRGNGRDG
ncbi:MAG: hypothetical protein ACR2L6_02030 [Gemmatimonadaceae bacterium]